ncbi:MAG: hypothetical protein Q8P41_08535 [Pseudomonadota bacterium]|nr:hypothetical protein [Pseudomonadota bacterium]
MPDDPTRTRDPVDLLDRVERLRSGAEGAHQTILAELHKERAQSYARAVAKVDDAYRALRAANAALDASPPAERWANLARYEEARARATYLRWELLVQREALGFNQNEEFDRDYPVPPRRR